MILVWELTPSKSMEVANKRTGQVKLVVQLTDIHQKLRDGRYHRVAVRRLDCDRTPERLHSVLQLKKQLEVHGYSAFINNMADSDEDLSAHFSAELIALAYQKMGLIAQDRAISELGTSFWLQDGDIQLEGGVLKSCVVIERSYEPMSKAYVVKETP
jgi:hypothetical protein